MAKINLKQAWDTADFQSVVDYPGRISGWYEKAVGESQAALQLTKLASESSNILGRPLPSGEKLKIVTILHSSLPNHTGGYTGRAQGLLVGLRKLGVELASYTRPGFYNERVDELAGALIPDDQVDGITYHHLPQIFPRHPREYEYMLNVIPQYEAVFKKEKPNVVHVRSTYLIALPALIAAHRLGIPVLYEVSGLWELVYEGRGDIGRARRTAYMEDLTCQYADRIVSQNSSMASLLQRRSKVNLEIGLVPNAVEPERFASVTPFDQVPDNAYTLGYVGSLVDYEGHSVLLKAISELKSRGVSGRVKIVGKGVEEDSLKKLAKELKIQDLVTFTGNVPADQVVAQFNDVHMIVLPRISTPATENVTPLKPFEAMAAGRPLIVSSVGALSELSDGGKYAAVFEQGNPVDLADVIQDLKTNPARQAELVQNGRALVDAKHRWDNVSKAMEVELRNTSRQVMKLSSVSGKEIVRGNNGLNVSLSKLRGY